MTQIRIESFFFFLEKSAQKLFSFDAHYYKNFELLAFLNTFSISVTSALFKDLSFSCSFEEEEYDMTIMFSKATQWKLVGLAYLSFVL